MTSDPFATFSLGSDPSHGHLVAFLLFTIPTGAGIPAGVLLGQQLGLSAAAMSGLYAASGLLRAALFEPVYRWAARRPGSPRVLRLREAMRKVLARSPLLEHAMRSAWAPMIVSYNLDPMAGRVAAAAVGMGWLRGWTLSLLADFAYFVSTAVPTLWLQSLIGNAWVTLALLMVVTAVVPAVWRRLRGAA